MAERDFEVGDTFRDWRVVSPIRHQGMAKVYVVRQPLIGRDGVMKVIRTAGPNAPELERFRTEAKTLFALDHPNTPVFYDAGLDEADGTAVLILERLEGFDLAELLVRVRRFTLGDALYVAMEVLHALETLHEIGVHRDIKPANVFACITPKRDSVGFIIKSMVRLLDFGLAKLRGGVGPTRPEERVGTWSYMAPEQMLGQEDLDGRADLYAVGALLYEMIAGRPLFVGQGGERLDAKTIVAKHLHEEPDLGIAALHGHDHLRGFLRTLLRKNRDLRYKNAHAARKVARMLWEEHQASCALFRDGDDDLIARLQRHLGARPAVSPTAPGEPNLETTGMSRLPEGLHLSRKPSIEVPAPSTQDPFSNSAFVDRSAIEAAIAKAGADQNAASTRRDPDTVPGPMTTLREPPTAPLPPVAPPGQIAHAPEVMPHPVATPGPTSYATERAGIRPISEWEVAHVWFARELAASTHCFLRPALRMPGGGVAELREQVTRVGSAPGSGVRIEAAGVEAFHVELRWGADRRLLVLSACSIDPYAEGAFRVNDRVVGTWSPLVHGTTLALEFADASPNAKKNPNGYGYGEFPMVVTELELPSPGAELALDTRRPRLRMLDATGRTIGEPYELARDVAVVGSCMACDFCCDGIPPVAFTVHHRADARVEVLVVDESHIPYGRVVQEACVVERVAAFPLGGGCVLAIEEFDAGPERAEAVAAKVAELVPHWRRSR